jgi:hypothetical protein
MAGNDRIKKLSFTVLSSITGNLSPKMEKELKRIKRVLREVLQDMNLMVDMDCNFTEESQIPDEVFQIFDSI